MIAAKTFLKPVFIISAASCDSGSSAETPRLAEVTRIARLSVPIPIQRVVEEEEKEEEDVKKTGKEEVAVASDDTNFVGTQLDLVCLGDEIVYGSSVPHAGDGTGENNNKLGLASGEVSTN